MRIGGVSAGKDISEEGCFFLSEAPFKVGEILDVKVQFPGVQEGMHFLGEVKRCEQEENQLDVYGVGMSFIEVDEEKKQTFLETLDFFLKRRKEKWSVEKNVFIRRYF